jgi:hypothetical protein
MIEYCPTSLPASSELINALLFGCWVVEKIEKPSLELLRTSLVFDSTGILLLLYYCNVSSNLRYAQE